MKILSVACILRLARIPHPQAIYDRIVPVQKIPAISNNHEAKVPTFHRERPGVTKGEKTTGNRKVILGNQEDHIDGGR